MTGKSSIAGAYGATTQYFTKGSTAYFLDGTVYSDGGRICCERPTDADLKGAITLRKCKKRKLPYNYYLYSTGRRSYYELTLPKDILKSRLDAALEFDFDGLNLQVFSGETLINDHFNIDRKFVMHLRDYREYIERDNTLVIRTVPKTRFGISNVYNEIPLPLHSCTLTLTDAKEITVTQV